MIVYPTQFLLLLALLSLLQSKWDQDNQICKENMQKTKIRFNSSKIRFTEQSPAGLYSSRYNRGFRVWTVYCTGYMRKGLHGNNGGYNRHPKELSESHLRRSARLCMGLNLNLRQIQLWSPILQHSLLLCNNAMIILQQ